MLKEGGGGDRNAFLRPGFHFSFCVLREMDNFLPCCPTTYVLCEGRWCCIHVVRRDFAASLPPSPSRNRVVKTGAERKERKEITSICISFVVVLFSRAICAANATDLCRAIYGGGGRGGGSRIKTVFRRSKVIRRRWKKKMTGGGGGE